jgi:hypothetical protein
MADVKRNYKIVLGVDDNTAGALAKIEGRFRSLDSKIFGALKWGALGLATALGFSVKAAAEQQDVTNRLRFSLEKAGVAYDAVKGELEGFFASQMKFTRFADEETAAAFTTILDLSGKYELSLRAVKIAQDFASTGIVGLDAAALLLGKTLAGSYAMLGRYGITMEAVEGRFGKAKTEAEKLDFVLRYMEGRFSGKAAADLDTFAGRLRQLKNYIGEAGEVIGNALLPQLTAMAKAFVEKLNTEDAQQQIRKFAIDVAENLKKVVEAIRELADFVREHSQTILGFFVALTALRVASWAIATGVAIKTLGANLLLLGSSINPLLLIAAAFQAIYNLLRKLEDMSGLSALLDKWSGSAKSGITGKRGIDPSEIAAAAREFQKLQAAESAAIPKPGDWDFIGPMMDRVAAATDKAAVSVKSLSELIKELGLVTSQELLDRQKKLMEVLTSSKDPAALVAARTELEKIHQQLLDIEIAYAKVQRAGVFGIRPDFMRGREGIEGALRPEQFEAPTGGISDTEERLQKLYQLQARIQARTEAVGRSAVNIGKFFASSLGSVFSRINTLADLAALRIKDVFSQLFADILQLLLRIAAQMAIIGILSLVTRVPFGTLAAQWGGIPGFGGGGGGGGGRAAGAGGPTPFIPPGSTPTAPSVTVNIHGDFLGSDEQVNKLLKAIDRATRYGQGSLAIGYA